MMLNKATLKTHARLMDDMADAVGVDLEEAMLQGRMTMDQLSDAVLSCTGCANPDRCASWLNQQEETAPATPSYCRNGTMLARLAGGKTA